MTRQKYAKRESWNRLLRLFQGNAVATDVPETISGEVLSHDEALSDIAELFAGSLPGQVLVIPTSVYEAMITSGFITGTAIGESVVEYGGIYNNATGSVNLTIPVTPFTKITGTFTQNMLSSDNITPDYLNDRITISKNGVYFVGMQLSFDGSINTIYNGAIFVDGVEQEPVHFRRSLGTGGDVGSASAMGIIQVTGTPVDMDIRVHTDDGNKIFHLEAGQLWIYGIP